MPRLSDDQKEVRRRQILEAVWRCVDRKGVAATSMDEIIAECGMSAGAVYLYFPGGKDALIAAAMKTSFDALGAELAPLFLSAGTMTADAFLAEAARVIERFSQREGYDLRRVAVHGWSQALIDPALREIERGFYDGIVRRLRPLVKKWPGLSADMLLALMLGNTVRSALLERNTTKPPRPTPRR